MHAPLRVQICAQGFEGRVRCRGHAPHCGLIRVPAIGSRVGAAGIATTVQAGRALEKRAMSCSGPGGSASGSRYCYRLASTTTHRAGERARTRGRAGSTVMEACHAISIDHQAICRTPCKVTPRREVRDARMLARGRDARLRRGCNVCAFGRVAGDTRCGLRRARRQRTRRYFPADDLFAPRRIQAAAEDQRAIARTGFLQDFPAARHRKWCRGT